MATEATKAVTQAAAEAAEEAAQADPQVTQVNYSPLQPTTAATGLKDLR